MWGPSCRWNAPNGPTVREGRLPIGALALTARDALEQVAEHDSPRVAAASREILQAAQADDGGQDQASQAPATTATSSTPGREWNPRVAAASSHSRRWYELWMQGAPRSGKLIATASADKTTRIWDTAAGALRATLEGRQGYVRAVAFSPDGG